MKALVVYDSAYGNTEMIAQAISKGLSVDDDLVPVQQAGNLQAEDLDGLDLLVVGSPTQRTTYIEGIKTFLENIPPGKLKGVNVAAFDTRIDNDDMQDLVKSRVTRFFVKMFLKKFAAPGIDAKLRKKGGKSVIEPEGFCVMDTEGPLKEGEHERAIAWGRQIAEVAISLPRRP